MMVSVGATMRVIRNYTCNNVKRWVRWWWCDQTTGHRTVRTLPVVESDFLLTVNLFWLRIALHYYWECMAATSGGS